MRQTFKKILVFILTLIAKGIIKRHDPTIVAITGSVGKTSTKDAIYEVLRREGSVRRSEKSFNSELGVPLSIIGAQNAWDSPLGWIKVIFQGIGQIFTPKGHFPKTLVLEVGADRPGDIRTIAAWLRPHVVVITRLPDVPVHIEFFPTVESLVEEKMSLAKGARKDGTIVLNTDDQRILAAKEKLPFKTVTFGTTGARTTLIASNVQVMAPSPTSAGGLAFKLNFEGKSFPVNLPKIYTESFLTVSLAALGVAYALGVNMLNAIAAIADYDTPPGRAHLLPGANDTILIDDTYNSSPAAAEAGLTMLKDLPFGKRKIAILGDMLELGKHTSDEHKKIGVYAKKCATILITVGMRSKETAAAARDAGMKKVYEVDTAVEAAEMMQNLSHTGDVIFIKGSQGMRMERVVKALMAEPDEAKDVLVRQDAEWKKK